MEATIAEPPFFLGKAILNTAYDYLEGKEVEAHVVLDNQLVTQDTVDSLVTKGVIRHIKIPNRIKIQI